jgi:hypothetical protein
MKKNCPLLPSATRIGFKLVLFLGKTLMTKGIMSWLSSFLKKIPNFKQLKTQQIKRAGLMM